MTPTPAPSPSPSPSGTPMVHISETGNVLISSSFLYLTVAVVLLVLVAVWLLRFITANYRLLAGLALVIFLTLWAPTQCDDQPADSSAAVTPGLESTP